MRQYETFSMVIVAVALIAFFLWQGGMPGQTESRVVRVVGVERFGDDPNESIRALCLENGEKVTASDLALRRSLETGERQLLVETPYGDVDVMVVDGPTGAHFRTRGDDTVENNLVRLPGCV